MHKDKVKQGKLRSSDTERFFMGESVTNGLCFDDFSLMDKTDLGLSNEADGGRDNVQDRALTVMPNVCFRAHFSICELEPELKRHRYSNEIPADNTDTKVYAPVVVPQHDVVARLVFKRSGREFLDFDDNTKPITTR